MNDDELIQREIDGLATPDESARLAALAAEHPEVAARLESLRGAARDLERAERFEPPPRLLDDVMRAVRTTRAAAPKFFAALRDVLRGMLQPHTVLALAGTFAIGLGVGALLLRSPGVSPSAVAGTALPGGHMARPLALAAEGAQGRARRRPRGARRALHARSGARALHAHVRGAARGRTLGDARHQRGGRRALPGGRRMMSTNFQPAILYLVSRYRSRRSDARSGGSGRGRR